METVKSAHMTRITYLDGWRGLAILGVVFAHFSGSDFINMGRLGVELFFVLSGRLMAEILFVRGTKLSYFFPRRISRVWPTLFVFASVCLSVSLLTGVGDATMGAWIAAITFSYNYMSVYGVVDSHWLDHTWTLSVEEHSYILLGMLAYGARRLKRSALPVMIALTLAAILNGMYQSWVLDLNYYQVYWRTDTRGASIFLGAISFLILRRETMARLRALPWLPLILAITGIALNINSVPDPIKYSLGTICLASSLALMGSSLPAMRKVLNAESLLFFGAISYSLYLWQQPLSAMIPEDSSPMIETLSRTGLLVGAVLIAYLSYRFIEKPCREGLNKLFKKMGAIG